MGSFSGSTISACVINGYNSGIGALGADQTSFYLGASVNTPIKELKVGAAFDYVTVGKQSLTGKTAVAPGKSVYQEAFGLYATYQATEKLSLNARGEYFAQSKIATGIGAPSQALEGTLTAQYDLWKNVLSRIELRWDHNAGTSVGGPGVAAYGGQTFGVGSVNNAFEVVGNVVYKF